MMKYLEIIVHLSYHVMVNSALVKQVKVKRLRVFLLVATFAAAIVPASALKQSSDPLDLKQFTELLPKTFKPKSSSPRGFCTWSFEPDAKAESRLEIFNSSQNPLFDEQAKAVLEPRINKHTFIKNAHWIVRFANDGKITTADGDAQIDYGPYMAKVQRTIKRNWLPPKQKQNKISLVRFKIHYDGQISNLKLSTGSGDDEYDKAGLAAVEATAKLDPLPEGAPDAVDIEFAFAYNIYSPPRVKATGPLKSAVIDALWQEAVDNQMQKVKEENKDMAPVITPKAKSKN